MDLSKFCLVIVFSLLVSKTKAHEQGPPDHPEEEYVVEWKTLEGNTTVTWRYADNGTHMYPEPVAPDKETCDASNCGVDFNVSTVENAPLYKALKGKLRRYFFADEYLSRCTECIAVAIQMNLTFERLTMNDQPRRPESTYIFLRTLLGPNYCEKAFQDYAHRYVDNISFIGPETINSVLFEDIFNHRIPSLLFRECQRIRSFLKDEELHGRWVANDYDMIKALCRKERGPLAACTRALVDYNPRELKMEVNRPNGLWHSFTDLILGGFLDRRLNEEYKILKAWYQNWDY